MVRDFFTSKSDEDGAQDLIQQRRNVSAEDLIEACEKKPENSKESEPTEDSGPSLFSRLFNLDKKKKDKLKPEPKKKLKFEYNIEENKHPLRREIIKMHKHWKRNKEALKTCLTILVGRLNKEDDTHSSSLRSEKDKDKSSTIVILENIKLFDDFIQTVQEEDSILRRRKMVLEIVVELYLKHKEEFMLEDLKTARRSNKSPKDFLEDETVRPKKEKKEELEGFLNVFLKQIPLSKDTKASDRRSPLWDKTMLLTCHTMFAGKFWLRDYCPEHGVKEWKIYLKRYKSDGVEQSERKKENAARKHWEDVKKCCDKCINETASVRKAIEDTFKTNSWT